MTGSIITRVHHDGRWQQITEKNREQLAEAKGPRRYDVRWRTPDGRQKAKTFAKAKEAERFLAKTVKSVGDGTYVDVRPLPMGQVLDKWIASLDTRVKEGSLKAATVRSYKAVVAEHLRPAFEHVRSDKLAGSVLEAWRATLAEQVAAGTMAPKYLVNIRNVLSAVLRWARHPSRGYLAHDPMAGLERLRLPKGKKRPHFEPDGIAKLLELAATAPPDDTIIKVAAFSGLRRGELFALKWADVDWGDGRAGGQLHVRGTLDYVAGVVTLTKTEDSERVVDVPQSVLDALAVHQVMCPPVSEGFIFRDAEGRPMDPDRWHKQRLVPLLERAGLRAPQTGLHSLRHSYVSLLAAAGEDARYIAEQVGHANVRLTQDLYTHVLKRRRSEAMQRLDRFNGHSTESAGAAGNTVDHDEA